MVELGTTRSLVRVVMTQSSRGWETDHHSGAGNDVFVLKPNIGLDSITDFQFGSGLVDVLEFDTSLSADFEAVLAAAAQVGNDTVITYDASNTVTMKNVALASLHDDDVRFVACELNIDHTDND